MLVGCCYATLLFSENWDSVRSQTFFSCFVCAWTWIVRRAMTETVNMKNKRSVVVFRGREEYILYLFCFVCATDDD